MLIIGIFFIKHTKLDIMYTQYLGNFTNITLQLKVSFIGKQHSLS